MLSNKNTNQIYELAKNISQTSGEKKEHLLIKFGKTLDQAFEKKDDSIIEATRMAINNNEEEVTQIINDEIELSIETIPFRLDKVDYESTLFLLPISIRASKEKVRIPSIKKIEEALLKASKNIINETTTLKVGAIRLPYEHAEDVSLFEWWDMHRQILNEDATDPNIQAYKNLEERVTLDELEEVIYTPVCLIKPDEIDPEDISELLEHESDLLMSLSEQFSTDDLDLQFLPLGSINTALENGKNALEYNKFDRFCETHIKNQNVEILVTPINDQPGSTCVFVLDLDDRDYIAHYVFECTEDDLPDFWAFISDFAEQSQTPLWRYETGIDSSALSPFNLTENQVLNFHNIIEKSDYIDSHATMTSYLGYNNNKKITLH